VTDPEFQFAASAAPALAQGPGQAVQGVPELHYAQLLDDGSGGGGAFGFFLPLVAMFLLFYALIIRPQQRQAKAHKVMLTQIQRGDAVVTSGGLHGKVTGVSDDLLTVEIAERIRVKVNRSAISSRTAGAEAGEKKS
jgi:preprotein translocase subunit YajC